MTEVMPLSLISRMLKTLAPICLAYSNWEGRNFRPPNADMNDAFFSHLFILCDAMKGTAAGEQIFTENLRVVQMGVEMKNADRALRVVARASTMGG